MIAILLAVIFVHAAPCFSQISSDLRAYLRNQIELSDKQIDGLRDGTPIAKSLPSRIPDEIFLFGVVYIKARPEAYVQFSRDFNRFRTLPGYLAIGQIDSPLRLADLKDFEFNIDEIKSLKSCRAGKCSIQVSSATMEQAQKSLDWAAPDLKELGNRLLQEVLFEQLTAYRRDGNRALGIYNDKPSPADVAERFRHLLSYPRAWPQQAPDFHNHLLSYPQGKAGSMEDTFYWAKVKFGLKPTLRIVHQSVTKESVHGNPVYMVAEKQLYANHYFRTALDLSFCVPDASDPNQSGFYLIKIMGSEQAGLTGFFGSIIRKIALMRSTSALKKALVIFKTSLEQDAASATGAD